jgi:hypothetical protein
MGQEQEKGKLHQPPLGSEHLPLEPGRQRIPLEPEQKQKHWAMALELRRYRWGWGHLGTWVRLQTRGSERQLEENLRGGWGRAQTEPGRSQEDQHLGQVPNQEGSGSGPAAGPA